MLAEVFTYKNLSSEYKNVLNTELSDHQIVYVIKDVNGIAKSVTTSVTQAIQKVQKKKCQ